MQKESNTLKKFIIPVGLFLLFIVYTALIQIIDVEAIGPRNSSVGFAIVNGFVNNLFGVHWNLYTITDWLGLVPIFVAFCFAVLGLVQLIKRRSLLKVDSSILVLGVFYIIVIATYIFFEFYKVNYRPVIIEGILETSYPSSTTMLVMCVMEAAVIQLKRLIKNQTLMKCVNTLIILFIIFMVAGRLISGVHWLTDILGAAIISTSYVTCYSAVNKYIEYKN